MECRFCGAKFPEEVEEVDMQEEHGKGEFGYVCKKCQKFSWYLRYSKS
jgi:hypothetical protein